MTSRYDAVLTAIPVILVGGMVGSSLLEFPSAVVPFSVTIEQFPLILAGVVAWTVVGHELVSLSTE